MLNYNKWKECVISINSLYLDPQNPRLPEADKNLTQRELIEELVEHDRVYDLAKEIADKGFFPTEVLIVIENEKRKYVIEGNRRLAALKLLVSPESAPTDYQKKFKSLSDRIDITSLKKVKIIIAPSRSAAAPIIMNKHTRSQVQRWSPVQQAKYYKQLLENGMTLQSISDEYLIPVGEITDFLQSYSMYNIACSLDLPEDVANLVRNSREFPVTTLDRLYRNTKVQTFLGIGYKDDKSLIGAIDPEEFKK